MKVPKKIHDFFCGSPDRGVSKPTRKVPPKKTRAAPSSTPLTPLHARPSSLRTATATASADGNSVGRRVGIETVRQVAVSGSVPKPAVMPEDVDSLVRAQPGLTPGERTMLTQVLKILTKATGYRAADMLSSLRAAHDSTLTREILHPEDPGKTWTDHRQKTFLGQLARAEQRMLTGPSHTLATMAQDQEEMGATLKDREPMRLQAEAKWPLIAGLSEGGTDAFGLLAKLKSDPSPLTENAQGILTKFQQTVRLAQRATDEYNKSIPDDRASERLPPLGFDRLHPSHIDNRIRQLAELKAIRDDQVPVYETFSFEKLPVDIRLRVIAMLDGSDISDHHALLTAAASSATTSKQAAGLQMFLKYLERTDSTGPSAPWQTFRPDMAGVSRVDAADVNKVFSIITAPQSPEATEKEMMTLLWGQMSPDFKKDLRTQALFPTLFKAIPGIERALAAGAHEDLKGTYFLLKDIFPIQFSADGMPMGAGNFEKEQPAARQVIHSVLWNRFLSHLEAAPSPQVLDRTDRFLTLDALMTAERNDVASPEFDPTEDRAWDTMLDGSLFDVIHEPPPYAAQHGPLIDATAKLVLNRLAEFPDGARQQMFESVVSSEAMQHSQATQDLVWDTFDGQPAPLKKPAFLATLRQDGFDAKKSLGRAIEVLPQVADDETISAYFDRLKSAPPELRKELLDTQVMPVLDKMGAWPKEARESWVRQMEEFVVAESKPTRRD